MPPSTERLGLLHACHDGTLGSGISTLWWLLQDATGRREVDQGREDARLRRIAEELAKEEETQRQWRVARGQVGDLFSVSQQCCASGARPAVLFRSQSAWAQHVG